MKKGSWLFLSIIFCLLIFGCRKEDNVLFSINPWIPYGSLTDLDGNTYKTILIGTQTWMAENLKTTKLNDGTPIPEITDAASWSNMSSPGCCWQNNDLVRKVTYGVLYNWYAVNTAKLCPSGWHVPSDAEWTELTDYLGGENIAGGKLKETSFKHWVSPNTGATNEVHFSALPGGNRLNGPDALFNSLLETGCWWATDSGESTAISRVIYDNSTNIEKFFYQKNLGLSVRCVRDY